MKKLFISLLIGVMVGGCFVGCGNKEVKENKIETKTEVESVYGDEDDKLVEEQSKEEIVEGALDTIRQMKDDVNSQMNESSEYFFNYTVITYDSYTNTVVVSDYTDSKDGEDNKYILSLTMAEDTSGVFASIKDTCDMEYESIKNLLSLDGVDDVDIIITKYMGDYKIFETKNGEVVYTIQ